MVSAWFGFLLTFTALQKFEFASFVAFAFAVLQFAKFARAFNYLCKSFSSSGVPISTARLSSFLVQNRRNTMKKVSRSLAFEFLRIS